jgi:hypothetical protein
VLQTIARMLGWTPAQAASGLGDLAAAAPPGLAVVRGSDLGMPPPLALDALRLRNRERTLRHRPQPLQPSPAGLSRGSADGRVKPGRDGNER